MIEERELSRVLPFSFWMDSEYVIYAAGNALVRRHPEIIGTPADTLFEVSARWASEDGSWQVDALIGRPINLIDRKDGLRLMGQFIRFGARVGFFASPQIATLEELKRYGLRIDEFAIHDGIVDRLLTVRSLDVSRSAEVLRAHELVKQERRFRNIVEHASDLILNLEENGEIVYSNPTTQSLFHQNIEQLSIIPFLTPASGEALSAGLRHIAAGGNQVELSLECFPADDAPPVFLEGQLFRNTADGDGVASGFFRNVTGERLAARRLEESQEQLRESQKMETVGRLAGGIAHDFNNLLGVIQAAAESIRESQPDRPLQEDLDLVMSSCEQGAFLSRQLLLFSRGSDATRSLRSVDLAEITQKTVLLVSRVLASDVTVRFDTSGPAALVDLDPVQFEQILINLAINAGHAMPEGGEFALRVDTKIEHVMVTATDTGTGMSRDVVSAAFDPFFTTKSKEAGSGLGLSVVYGIVTAAGGSIRIDSEIDRGTQVIIQFPISTAEETGPVSAQEPEVYAQFLNHPRVVVVEDQNDLRRLVTRMLERWGCEVRGFPGLKAARAASDELEGASLLVTDAQLGDGNGVDLACEWIDRGTCRSVLVITGYAELDVEDRTSKIEECEVLTKPFTMRELNRAVDRSLRRGRFQRE